METDAGWLRIGELSRRVGLSDHVLRAWERRYGLLSPVRTSGGFRLYSLDDERRVRLMQALLARGLSAAEGARATLAEIDPLADARPAPDGVPGAAPDVVAEGSPTDDAPLDADDAVRRLTDALTALDEPAAQAVLDDVLRPAVLEEGLRDVVLPYLHGLGTRWQRGEVSVAQEHVASNVVRGRLTALARGWGAAGGPRAVLACPPGERHDLALLVFGVVLARHGWAVDYLGADTPGSSVAEVVAERGPAAVVLAATAGAPFDRLVEELAGALPAPPGGSAGAAARVLVAGAGATPGVAQRLGAELVTTDPVTAARALAAQATG